jgi:hypothetical protein
MTGRRISWDSILALTSLSIAMVSIVVFAIARVTGVLPSESNWDATGHNHGPWADSLQGMLLVFLPELLTFGFAVILPVSGLIRSIRYKKVRFLSSGLLLGCGSLFLSWTLVWMLGWLID